MKIGIPGQQFGESTFGVNMAYMEFAALVGSPHVFSSFNDVKYMDGFLLPGGADVLPSRYRGFPIGCGKADPYMEWFDAEILPQILGEVPIFGICRGLQTINVLMGGTLKNLWGHPYSQTEDEGDTHKVVTGGGLPFSVNSFHHQAIKNLAAGLVVEAQSKDDSLIEALSGKLIEAVQWHPERLGDTYSRIRLEKLFGGRGEE